MEKSALNSLGFGELQGRLFSPEGRNAIEVQVLASHQSSSGPILVTYLREFSVSSPVKDE